MRNDPILAPLAPPSEGCLSHLSDLDRQLPELCIRGGSAPCSPRWGGLVSRHHPSILSEGGEGARREEGREGKGRVKVRGVSIDRQADEGGEQQ